MTSANRGSELRRVLRIRTTKASLLGASLALLAWGFHLYGIVVRPWPGVPFQLVWIVFVGCGILLPGHLWNRTGTAEIVRDESGGSHLRCSGPGQTVVEVVWSDLAEVQGDDRMGRVRLRWAQPGQSPLDLFCRDAADFAAKIRAAAESSPADL